MKTRTRSATPLAPVMIETAAGITHVWLRKGITQTTDPDNGQDVYDADEVYYLAEETPTVEEVEAEFNTLWAEHEDDDQPETTRLRARISDLESALAEVADLIASGGE